MPINSAIRSLEKALMQYKGDKGKHSRVKNEITRQLLLTIMQHNLHANDLHYRNCVYTRLHDSQLQLLKLKDNRKGTLDSLLNTYLNKLEKYLPIELPYRMSNKALDQNYGLP